MSRHVPAEILPEGFRNKIFDTEIIAALERALNDEKDDIRSSTVHIFTAAISQGALFFSRHIHTEIFAEGGWDKRVQAEIVAALGRALNHEKPYVRSSVVQILTGAVAQGALLFFFIEYSYHNIRRGLSG